MWYADTVGLKRVYARMHDFHQRSATCGNQRRCF